MTLLLHDTMSRELVAVEPIEPGHVRMYTCGPTVWNRVHIGNFRTFVFEDVLRRWLDRRAQGVQSRLQGSPDVDRNIQFFDYIHARKAAMLEALAREAGR